MILYSKKSIDRRFKLSAAACWQIQVLIGRIGNGAIVLMAKIYLAP
jgi:hypothetical protein